MPTLTLVNPRNGWTIYGDYRWQPLSLAYIAAATPEGWEIRVVDEALSPVTDADLAVDVVGLTAFTTQVTRAYDIAARARALGAKTVLGGVHATFLPDEAARYVDSVVLGEAEEAWPRLLADFRRGALAPRYTGERTALDALALVPRRDLLAPGAYDYASVQTTRGCPLNCSFCSVTAFNGRTFRTTADEWAIAEFSRVPEARLLVVDDDFNGFSRAARDRALRLSLRLADEAPRKRWATQVTINFGDEDELPRAAARAGCTSVFIGFESIEATDLANVAKKRYRGRSYFVENIRRIRDAGIAVIGSFILGIDGQDVERTVDDTLAFLEETHIDGFNPTLLTPLPGTRDRTRYLNEGRILHHDFPADWIFYDLGTPTIRPSGITPARLYRAYLRLMTWFEPSAVVAHAARTARELGMGPAETTYMWNRPWSAARFRSGDLPATVEEALFTDKRLPTEEGSCTVG